MAKSKDRSEVEYLRGLVKDLKAQVRHLKKEVSRSNKRAHMYEDLEERQAEVEAKELYKVNTKQSCKECNSTDLDEVNLGIRKITVCKNCGKRTTVKNG